MVVSLVLAACGGSSSDESAPDETPASTAAAPTTTAAEPAPVETAAPTTEAAAPTTEAATPTTDATAPATTEAPTTTEPPEPEVMWPDDGCSADNSPTPAAAADGPAPVVEVRAESADSPLPDLAVRRINCKGGWENLRNELPSDRPLLVWFWAPH